MAGKRNEPESKPEPATQSQVKSVQKRVRDAEAWMDEVEQVLASNFGVLVGSKREAAEEAAAQAAAEAEEGEAA